MTGGRPGTGGRVATGGREGGNGGAAGKGGAGGAGGMPAPDASGDVVAADADDAASADGVSVDVPIETAAEVGPVKSDAAPDVQAPKDTAADLPKNLPNGMACLLKSQCLSGNCVDGFCCNTSCTNPCQACAMAKTGDADGKCVTAPQMVGMKCGRGCQQFPGQALLVVVDKVCTAAGQCAFPQIPQAPEYCADTDPCTTINCVQDTAYAARCAKTAACAGNTCCCVTASTRACMTKTSCTGQGKVCM